MRSNNNHLIIILLMSLIGCQSAPKQSVAKSFLMLPEAISNNAVASASVQTVNGNQDWLYSFNGLLTGKDWRDVSSKAFAINPKTGESKRLTLVPGNAGRLASIAATVNNQIYIFGGYTVAADHSEVSTPQVYRFDPQTEKYELITQMPTPVDDSVALVYQDRYIYLISGWHNNSNVSLVQVLDTKDMSWHQATPYPGAPVFGHAGGIVDNKIVVSDGVKVLKVVDGKRQYGMSDDNYLGIINPNDFRAIDWKKLPMHPSQARYRMAATGSERLNKVIFVGGSDNPYNFNGIGYNGIPSEPSSLIFAYDLSNNQWQTLSQQNPATMDHRGLLEIGNNFYILGGILDKQETTAKIFKINLD